MDGRTPPTNIAAIKRGFPNTLTLLIVGASPTTIWW